jgi:hypothetical protein
MGTGWPAWAEHQRQAGKIHVDQPGEIRWFSGHGPRAVVGPCPHITCRHLAQGVIAWGPDYERYELIECTGECARRCRAWTDGGPVATTPWLHVAPEEAPDAA